MFWILKLIFFYIINFIKWKSAATSMAESASSTLSPTEEERYNQGTHELELHYRGEIELHQYPYCDKNPGHVDFRPVHSPLSPNITDLQSFSLRAASLTTKLKVRYVSSGRSKENMKNLYNIDHYPLSAYAGKKKLGVGSGCVTDIDVSGDEGSFPCPLENCPHSTEPHQVYGYIIITTAAHVVFDDDEAKNTTVEFFDDDPMDNEKKEIAHGVKVRHCSVEGDFCEFMCVTHSQSLFGKISELCSPSITFVPQFLGTEKEAVRILRLFKYIRIFQLPSELKPVLGCSEDTSKKIKSLLSTWQKLQSEESVIVMSLAFKVKHFLNAAENASGISGLQDSIKSILYQRCARSRDNSVKELCTIVDIDTTVKRISLIWTLHLLLPEKGIPELLLKEDIYISFFGIWHVKDCAYSQPRTESTKTYIDPLVENCFEIRLRIVQEILLFIKDQIDEILMYQPRETLYTTVSGIFSKLMDDLHRVSDYLDQVFSTLSRGDTLLSEFLSLKTGHDFITDLVGCRYRTKLWNTKGLNSNHNRLSTMIGLRQEISGLIMKFVNIEKITDFSLDWEDMGLKKNFRSIERCLFHCKKAIIEEVKDNFTFLYRSVDVFQKLTKDTLVIHFSHPHGQSKQVTIGEHFSCNTHTGYYEHIYTVPTCMGCSGGPVWIIPKGEKGEILWDQVYGVPHSGCYDRGNKLNHSSSWTFSPPFLKQETTDNNTVLRDLGADNVEKKRWLVYLLEPELHWSHMLVADVSNLRKSIRTSRLFSRDDSFEDLLDLA